MRSSPFGIALQGFASAFLGAVPHGRYADYYKLFPLPCQGKTDNSPGQQHLKLSKKDIKKTLWIQGGGK
ncbi:hypothetical protein D7Y41_31060, partial [Anaerotruncus sp. 1XD22-93]